jgi:uncharacterized protein YjbI with pentapeptide repeats
MDGTQQIRRRAYRLASVALVVAAGIGLATACSTTLTGTVTLVPTRPGQVSNLIGYLNLSSANHIQIRFTSGTGRAITVDPSHMYADLLPSAGAPTTVTDTGAASPWTTVSPVQPRSTDPRVSLDRIALRLTTTATTEVPLSFEVRGIDANQQPTAPVVPFSPFGPDCWRARANTDQRDVDLSGLDLHNCILPGVTFSPGHLTNTKLDGAELSRATILPGTLDHTHLHRAELGNATLSGVDLTTATISGAHLAEADFDHAVLRNVSLETTDLDGTKLATATLDGVSSGLVTGSPLLPPGWVTLKGYLVHRTARLEDAALTGVDLHGFDLRGVDLENAALENADLHGADLTGANLSSTHLRGANIAGAKLADASLLGVSSGSLIGTPASLPSGFTLTGGYLLGPGSSLSHVNFAGIDLRGRDLTHWLVSYADLRGANLAGANLTDANISDSDLTGADLTGANLTGASLGSSNITGVKLAGAHLDNLHTGGLTGVPASVPAGWRAVADVLVGPTATASADLTGLDLSGVDLHGFRCDSCITTGTKFVGSNLQGSTFHDLSGADLTDANLTGAHLSGSLVGSTITGADFGGAVLDYLLTGSLVGQPAELPPEVTLLRGYFVGPHTQVENADFSGLDLRNVSFTGGGLNVVDLTGADVRGASFAGTTMYYVKFNGARIDGADFSGGVSWSQVDLTSATGTPSYAGTRFDTTTCPDGTLGSAHDDSCQGHPWP